MDTGDAFLSIGHHLAEEVGEAGAAELGGACAVEVSVVNCFAVGGGAEAGVLLLGLWGSALGGGLLLEGCGRGKGFGPAEGGGCARHFAGKTRLWRSWRSGSGYPRVLGIASDLDLYYSVSFPAICMKCFLPDIISCEQTLYSEFC